MACSVPTLFLSHLVNALVGRSPRSLWEKFTMEKSPGSGALPSAHVPAAAGQSLLDKDPLKDQEDRQARIWQVTGTRDKNKKTRIKRQGGSRTRTGPGSLIYKYKDKDL